MLAHLWRKLVTLTGPPDLPAVRTPGRVWYLTPAGAELFGPAGPRLDRWLADGSAVAVKANATRTLYRVEVPAGTVYVKHCRVTSPRGWLREAIRPPKARLEFENALALRAGGIPAVEPLAWGGSDSHWPGDNFLITRAVPGVPFTHYLEHHLPALRPGERPAARRQAARALARLFALLHDAGVNHPDPHPGNLLVEITPCGVPRLTLLDLHDVRTGPPLGWAESRENLVLLNRYFELRADRADRARFWHAYRGARVTLPPPDPAELRARADELERATRASNLRFWAAREQRWLGSNRTIRRVRHGTLRGLAVRDLSDDFLRTLLADPDAPFAAATGPHVLKDCASSTVVVIPMPTAAGPVPVVFKRVNAKSWVGPVKNLFHRSAVLRSWSSGQSLRDRCLPTPRPLAVFHRRRLGFPTVGYLLTELVPGAVQLDAAVAAGAAGPLLRLARVLRMMHDRGVSHRDLKAANILLANGADPVLIDLVGVRTGVRIDVPRRAKELARLNVSFLSSRRVTRSDRLRFLRAYLAAGPALGVGWKKWWALVSRATAAKVERNRRAGRALA